MGLDLKINTKMVKKLPIIELEGEVDVYTYPALNQAMLALIKEGYTTIIVNLDKVSYIDSTGLGVLANSTNKVSEKDGEVRIICTQPQLIKVFSVSGLTSKNLKIFSTETEAVQTKSTKPKKKK
jgi:anti-sigma B factor antagonist